MDMDGWEDGRMKVGIDIVVSSRSVNCVKDHVLVCIDLVGSIHPELLFTLRTFHFSLSQFHTRLVVRCGCAFAHVQAVRDTVTNVVPRAVSID